MNEEYRSTTIDLSNDALRAAFDHANTHRADAARRAVTVLAATLVVLCAAAGVLAGLQHVEALRRQLVVAVFMEPSATKVQVETATGLLRRLDNVDSVIVKSPVAVQQDFAARFGNEIDRLLPDNPFPTQATLLPAATHRTKAGLGEIADKAHSMRSVAEATFNESFAEAVDARNTSVRLTAWLASLVVALAALVLLWNSVYQAATAWYAGFVSVVGVLCGCVLYTGLWFALKNHLAWLAELPKAPIVWIALGVLFLGLLLSIGQAQLPSRRNE